MTININSDNVGHFTAMDSKSTTSNGFPAATCVSSYTDSTEKKPGRVHSRMAVAAPDALYLLTCDASSEDQEKAEIKWHLDWKDAVTHIQSTLHLADAKK
jgi:hypothetical protein